MSELGLIGHTIVAEARELFDGLDALPLDEKIAAINIMRRMLHAHSPFKDEPVDCVTWVKAERVEANDYNPNTVAPPEMRLLADSISKDGYTQPIVAWHNAGTFQVVDGFHRNRVGKENKTIRERVHGYLPVTLINQDRTERGDRQAATIRHNRARGKHQVTDMAEIVQELAKRNWSEAKIARELGMDKDEVLRYKQVGGLAALFADTSFSEAWD